MARFLFKSLKGLKGLPGDCIVLPAHGAGSACGKAIASGDRSTISAQLESNAAFKEDDENTFIEMVTEGLTPPPEYWKMDVSMNKAGAIKPIEDILNASFHPLPPQKVKDLSSDPLVYIIDVRRPPEFAEGHLPGSINMTYDQPLEIWAAYVVDPKKNEKVILVVPDGKEREAIARLARTGLDCVIGFLEGGIEAWTKAEMPLAKTAMVNFENADELKKGLEGSTVIDVRYLGEWKNGVYPGAKLISLPNVKEQALLATDKGAKISVYCKGGGRSILSSSLLERLGFTNVHNINGGFEAMKSKGLAPAEFDEEKAVRTF